MSYKKFWKTFILFRLSLFLFFVYLGKEICASCYPIMTTKACHHLSLRYQNKSGIGSLQAVARLYIGSKASSVILLSLRAASLV